MKRFFSFFIPKYLNKVVENLLSVQSFINLVNNPFKWIRNNKSKITKIIVKASKYLFTKPRLKWIDYNVDGFLKYYQAEELYNMARSIPNYSVIVEIGAYLGRSTCFISEAIKSKNIKFYSIDSFKNHAMSKGFRDTFKEYFKNIFQYRNELNIIKGFSFNVVKNLLNLSITILWIDGDHSYEACKKDIDDWFPLVKEKGFIVFHDYHINSNTNVAKAVDEKIKENKLKKVKRVGKLMITQKNHIVKKSN